MKAAVWIGLLALLGSARAATAPTLPADYFTRDVKPLNVTPTTDADNSYSDVIGPDGGQLTTLDAAGNTYTLTVPKGALGFPERLTMTPLTALKGIPFKDGVNAGVQLEPEGTFFVKPVTLEVEFADKPNLQTITPFNFTGAGQDFTTTMLMRDPGHYVFLLNHFSGAGFANSNEAEQTAEAVRQPQADEERIQHYVQEQLGKERQRQLLGQDSNGLDTAVLAKAMAEYEKQVIGPLKEASTKSCTVGLLYITKVLGLERQKQLLGVDSDSSLSALASGLGPIAEKCLDEEAQVCFKTGDFLRLTTFYLGVERQAQLLGGTMGDAFKTKYDRVLKACAHFEVQVNSTLTEKGNIDLAGVFPQNSVASIIQGQGITSYSATITSILPIKISAMTFLGSPAELPNGHQPLPYAGFNLNETYNGSTMGLPAHCVESGTGTTPGLIAAQFLPIFKAEPPDPNAPNPNLEGLSPAQKRDVIRILHNTPKYGLLAPPRKLDLPNTILTIGVGTPTEHTLSSCGEQKHSDPTTWLDSWNKQLKAIGEKSAVTIGSGATTEPGWALRTWQNTTTFPLKIVQDVPHHEAIGGGTYDETWHLDITVVHTPKE
ncbi:hypothetical protein E7T09_19990 [Deinococcus sp. KSM4-11]|uniref:hypothetical protein n=1 Tax=Deinococcus sp. KSM4-11 TaxID=2568654 RepID=UPI0010A51125|nr:hypothetical protein [Deinococcus sp. KSM4-11]THF84301.1 hypothetical protein E7T09_19990 [Deinococcus sp. KSM4-11]